MTSRAFLYFLPLVLLAGCKSEPTAATVAKRDVEGFMVLKGELYVPPTDYAAVLPPYNAPVEKVMVTEGAQVREGEVLMQLSFPGVDAAYEQARANLKTAQAAYEQARQALNDDVKRLEAEMKGLKDRQAAGEEVSAQMAIISDELQIARTSLENQLLPYKEQVRLAQSYLTDAQAGAKQASIRAPLSGTVIQLNAQAGQTVGEEADRPVAVICDLEEIKVYAPLSEAQAGVAKKDMDVVLTFEGLNETFEGTISRIVTRPGEKGVQYVAVVEFRNEQGLVKPGAKVKSAAIKTGVAKDVLAVPTEAVDQDDTGKPIVKILRGEKWVPTVVEVGLSGNGYTEIRSGLKEGETVQVTP